MENSKLNLQKIKEILHDSVVRTVLVTFLTVLVTLGIIFGIAWHYRAHIFYVLAVEVNRNAVTLAQSPLMSLDTKKEEATVLTTTIPILTPEPVVIVEDTVVTAVKKAKPAVVSIIVSKDVAKFDVTYKDDTGGLLGSLFRTPIYTPNGTERKQIGSGSGFLISSDGMIVTNRHVVDNKDAIYEVQLNNGKKYTATVLARDGVLDVALVKIVAKGLPYLDLGNSDTLDVGQSVVAIGNALGEFKNTVSVGVVSGLSRSVTAGDSSGMSERLDKVIQTDAAINPGNSGGPLLDLKGQVIGINVAVVQGSSNVGFALPINSVKSAITSVKNTGKIVRPYVGVRYTNITADVKAKNNLTVDYGILVQKGALATEYAVMPGSPAERAGIVDGDIILEVNGTKLDTEQSFSNLIRSKKVGDTINMRVLSKGSYRIVSLKLEAAPDTL